MDFVALDFETANEKRHSPCSLGICIVENNEVVLERYWLIRPYELRFAPMNIWIHGFREGDVVNEAEFDVLWEEICPLLEGKLVIAHNAAFDMSVLRQTLSLYNLPYPTFDYCCTMVMSKHFYPYLENAKLNTVSKHLGFHFNHHHAAADALACANILLNISSELNIDDITQLTKCIGVKIGQIFPGGYRPAGSDGGGIISKRASSFHPKKDTPTYNCETDFFKDKIVAFTGPLSSMSRSEAIHLIERCGGDYSPSVTLKTSIVVTGMKDPLSLRPDQMSTKLRRAMELISRGQEICILDEAQFLSYMNS